MAGKSDNRVLTENFISLALTQIISYAMPLITLPYLSRVLGAEKFGLVYWAQAAIQYFIIITDFGFGLSAVKEISIYRDDKDKINQIFNSIMLIKVFLILFCFLIMTVMILVVPKFHNEWLLFCLTFFMVIGNAIYPIWYFQGIEHMKYITFFNILSKSLFLFLIFIFVKDPSNYILVALLNSLGFIISGILGMYIACKRFGLKLIIPSKDEVIYQFKYSLEFFLSRIAGVGYTNTNAFVLGLIANPVMVAYYTAAEKIYIAMLGLVVPFSQALYPYVAKKRDTKKFKKIFYFALGFLVLMSLFVFVFAKDIIGIFYGAELLTAYKVLRIFCVTIMFSFVTAMIGYTFLGALGHTKEANYSVIYACIFHIAGLFILLYFGKANIYNIALMTAASEFISVGYRILAIKKYKLWNN